MIPLIVIGAIAFVPVLLSLIFRVHGLFVFLAACGGYFLQFALSDDFDLAFATIIKGSNSMVAARLVLFALPILLTLFFLRKSIGKGMLMQLIPLVLTGLFIGVLTLPLLPSELEQSIYATPYGGNIKGAQDLIIAAAITSNMLLMWSLFGHRKEHKKHH